MLKKCLAWFLVVALLITFLPQMGQTALADSDDINPSVSSISEVDWDGYHPTVGDNAFYLEAYGNDLLGLTMEFWTFDDMKSLDEAYLEKVASQSEVRYMGKTQDGEDWVIYKMAMDGGQSLGTGIYAGMLVDYNTGDVYKPNQDPVYFYAQMGDMFYVKGKMPTEISTDAITIDVNVNAYGFETGLTKDDISLELVSCDGIGWDGEPNGTVVEVGTADELDSVDEIYSDGIAYQIKGTVTLNDSLEAGQKLYAKVIGTNRDGDTVSGYGAGPTRVISADALTMGQFNIENAIPRADVYISEDGNSYMAADGKEFSIDLDEDILSFTMTGTNISDSVLFDVTLNGEDCLRNGSFQVQETTAGLYTVSGILDISADILTDASFTLVFKYNDASIYEAQISRSDIVSISYEDNNGEVNDSYTDYYTYAVPACGPIEVTLVQPMNLDLDGFTALLTPIDTGDDAISVSVQAEKASETSSDILLTITPDIGITGRYMLEIKYEGSDINKYYYDSLSDDFIISAPMDAIYYEIGQGAVPITTGASLKAIKNNEGNLNIYGNNFDTGASYTAHFIKRTGTTFNAPAFEVSVTNISSGELYISKENLSGLPLGWYTVYLEENGVQVNGFSDVSLLSTSDEEPVIVLPTVKINNGEASTINPNVVLNFTQGSYSYVKFAESQDELGDATWLDLADSISYTLSEGTGIKTIYFSFKTQLGDTYQTNTSILLKNENLEGFMDYGIANAVTDGVANVSNASLYTLYINYSQPGLTGKVEFVNAADDIVHTEDLKCTSGKDGVYTYSKRIRFSSIAEVFEKLRFYMEDTDGYLSPAEELPVVISSDATIQSKRTEFSTYNNWFKTYAVANSPITYNLTGTPDYNAKAKLTYENSIGEEAVVTYVLTESITTDGFYQYTDVIPLEASKIVSITYTLTDPISEDNSADAIISYNMDVTATMEFDGLDNSEGAFDGKLLAIVDNDTGIYAATHTITNGETEFTIDELVPGTYVYEISDEVTTYISNTVEIKAGQSNLIHLDTSNKPAQITFNVVGVDDNCYMYCTAEGESVGRYGKIGDVINGFYVGQNINYKLNLSEALIRNYKIPAAGTAVLVETQNVNIELEEFDKVKVSGQITRDEIIDQPLPGITVSVEQTIENGSDYSFYYTNSVVTDSNGNYEIEIYDDIETDLSFSGKGYKTQASTFTAAGNEVRDMQMAYNDEDKLLINLWTYPLIEDGETADEDSIVALDRGKIRKVYVKKENGTLVNTNFNPAQGIIDLSNGGVLPGETLYISFDFYDSLLPSSEVYEVTLNEDCSGSVNPVALLRGEMMANIPSGGDNPPTSYMLVFNNEGLQVGMDYGYGYVSSHDMSLNDGTYTVIFLYGYDLDKISGIKMLDAFNMLNLEENIQYIKKSITITRGILVNEGSIEVPEMITGEDLGLSDAEFVTRYIPDEGNGKISVVAQIDLNMEDVGDNFEIISVNIHSTGEIENSTLYYNGVKYSGAHLPPIAPASPDNKSPEGILCFNIIPAEGGQATPIYVDVYYTKDSSVIGNAISERFTTEVDTTRVTVEPPEQVFINDPAREVYVRGSGIRGSAIEIYDNETLVGKAVVKTGNYYETTIALTNPEQVAVHHLQAKMITEDNTYESSIVECTLIDPEYMAYTSHFTFDNMLPQITVTSPMDSNTPVIGVYNVMKNSQATFRINNLLKDQLLSVALVNTVRGVDNMFPATHVMDVDTDDETYSVWKVDAYLGGLVGDLSVCYTLAHDQDLGPITGTKPLDFASAIATDPKDLDLAQIPQEFRDYSDIVEVENTDNRFEVNLNLGENDTAHVVGEFSENYSISEIQLMSEGFKKFAVSGGYYWLKESVVNNGNQIELKRTIYFSPGLTTLMKETGIGFNSDGSYELSGTVVKYLSAAGFINDTLSKLDFTGYIYNAGDIAFDFDKIPSGQTIGKGMQVAGGAVLVGQILMGRTTKDANALYSEVRKIEDSSVQNRLNADIREYAAATRSHYYISSLFGIVNYGASFAGPVGKGLSFIVGTGGMAYSQGTSNELDIWWDAIMRDIQNEINRQEIGKKDKLKRPKWKLDPSGYVFEAIESNRVEGITASALIQDFTDDFVFWDEYSEWEEVNPLTTDNDGKYGWDVPEGVWKVLLEGEGYQTTETKEMTVPPIHDQVNIGLLSTKKPTVSGVTLDQLGAEIEWDMFMQEESIYDPENNVLNITITDSSGVEVPCKQIDFIIQADNTGYRTDDTYQSQVIGSESFVKRIRFVADDIAYPGGFRAYKDDGITPETYNISVNNSVRSYSGVQMNGNYVTDIEMSVVDRAMVSSPTADINEGHYDSKQTVSLETETAGATIYYTTDGSQPGTLSRVYEQPLEIAVSTVIRAIASKVGMDDSDEVILNYSIGKDAPLIVSAPIASVSSGTYYSTKSVALTSQTEGALIYYTMDGTTPTTDSTLYTGSITVSQSIKLKAIAVKDGYANSSVVTYIYTIGKKTTGGNGGSPVVNGDTIPEPGNSEQSPEGDEPWENPYIDIETNHWYYKAIEFVNQRHLFEGTTSKSFGPDISMTRAMLVTVLWRLEDKPESGTNSFKDVGKNTWYSGAVAWATGLGIVSGTGKGNFDPDKEITREQIAVMLYNFAKSKGLDVSGKKDLSQYKDEDDISSWALEAMEWAAGKGLINGRGNDLLDPASNATRAEVASILQRFIEQFLSR